MMMSKADISELVTANAAVLIDILKQYLKTILLYLIHSFMLSVRRTVERKEAHHTLEK